MEYEGAGDSAKDTREVARVRDRRRDKGLKLGNVETEERNTDAGYRNRCKRMKSRQHLAESTTDRGQWGGGGGWMEWRGSIYAIRTFLIVERA